MCGIFGYIGDENSAVVCLDGLEKLEYRGYDSAGIAGIKNHEIFVCKEVGNVSVLKKAVENQNVHFSTAIAHTRWATHGKPSQVNAHPHLDQTGTVALVHNGVIENYATLKDKLTHEHQVRFVSETDTEVVVQLIGLYYDGQLPAAVRRAVHDLEGSYALAIIHKDYPDQIVAVAKDSPLVVGFSKHTGELYVTSDPNALSGQALEFYYLLDGEMAVLNRKSTPLFYDKNGNTLTKSAKVLESRQRVHSKESYDHFMLKEIFEQAYTIKDAIFERFNEAEKIVHFNEIQLSPEELKQVKHILLLGCGTSYHAGCIAAILLESIARISAKAEIASEFRYSSPVIFPNTLVIALSQSGETADTIAAVRMMKEKGVKIVSLCNVPNSTLERESDSTIYLKAGPEIAVASTKTFTSQLAILYLFTLMMARLHGLNDDVRRVMLRKIYEIPEQVVELLRNAHEIEKIAYKYAHVNDLFFLGRGLLYPTALEAALKLKEIAYIDATGYPGGEMKHGPIALLSPAVPVCVMCANARVQQKIMSNLMESKARGAPIIAFAWKDFKEEVQSVTEDIIWIPKTSEALAPILLSIAAQLFAYYAAKKRGAPIDQPRNLAKSVTVE